MAKRKIMVVGNWKMNKVYVEGLVLANTIIADLEKLRSTIDIVLCPPFIHIQTVYNMLKEYPWLHVGAQNCHQLEAGAYTGEVTAAMLKSVGAEYIIIGHSERRAYFNESPELLAQKVQAVIKQGLSPIFCCGENLEIREANTQESFVQAQIEQSLFSLSASDFKKVVIAYEPIWAIGTGIVASPEQAEAMHASIRNLVTQKYGTEIAQQTTILYGGSCQPSNVLELFSKPDIDGALVGSSSLNAQDFIQIVKHRAAKLR